MYGSLKPNEQHHLKNHRPIHWIFDYEQQLYFPKGFNLSRLLPLYSDLAEFYSLLSKEGRASLSFEQRLQAFCSWLVDCQHDDFCSIPNDINSAAKAENLFPEYNIGNSCGLPQFSDQKHEGNSGRLHPFLDKSDQGNSGGLPPKTAQKNLSFDHARFKK